mmetsp:Transcript_19199/g.38708  ORF Transcript_19199/g.38708 Transcript_19199/m.38708 type:complete len:265 (-) Transcript_19199:1653-2447(-)
MIRPKHNNRIILLGKVLVGINQHSNGHIGIGNACQISLDGINLPIQFGHILKFLIGVGEINTRLGDVVQIPLPLLGIGESSGQFNLILGVHIVILLGDDPGQVRFDNPACQKDRLITVDGLLELLRAEFGSVIVGDRLVIQLLEVLVILGESVEVVRLGRVAILDLGILVPLVGVHRCLALKVLLAVAALGAVVRLTASGDVVTVLLEVSVDAKAGTDEASPGMVAIVVAAGGGGASPGQDCGPGRVADRRGGVSVGEGDSHLG